MSTLAVLLDRIQAQLLDDGTVFTDATCTAAARRALQEFNRQAPNMGGSLVATVTEQLEYELVADDFPNLMEVLDVLEADPDGEEDKSVGFRYYWEDGRPFIRLNEVTSAADLIVRYSVPHTINGLDSATETSLNADQEQIFIDGACAAAILTRLLSRIETINLAPDIVKNYQEAMGHFEEAFSLGLARYGRHPFARSKADDHAWNDTYHTWEQ